MSASFIVQLAGQALMYGTLVLMTRVLGTAEYGIYVVAITAMQFAAILARFGFDTALVKEVAIAKERRAWGLLAGLLRQSDLICLLVCTVFASAGALVTLLLFASPTREALWIACVTLPFVVMLQLRQVTLRALLRPVRSLILDLVARPAVLGVGILVFYTLYRRPEAVDAMMIYLGLSIALFVIAHRWRTTTLDPQVATATPEYRTRAWLALALPMLFVDALHVMLVQIDTLMIAAYVDPATSGIYKNAGQVARSLQLALVAVTTVIAPMMATLYLKGDLDKLQRILTRASIAVCAAVGMGGLVLLVAGEWILGIFGADYEAGYPAMMILVVGQLVNAAAGPVGYLMTMSGHHRQAAYVIGLSTLVNVVLNATLIPRWGIEGAAIATASAAVLWNLLLVVYARGKLGLSTTVLLPVSHRHGQKTG